MDNLAAIRCVLIANFNIILFPHTYKKGLLLVPLLLLTFCLSSRTSLVIDSCLVLPASESIEQLSTKEMGRPSPILKLLRQRQQKNKKLIAAVLAFPFPFGIVGLHRIYLGCAPYVPVAYIASLGGVFGVLPFIDFCVILAAKKTDPWTNNDKIFMWVN